MGRTHINTIVDALEALLQWLKESLGGAFRPSAQLEPVLVPVPVSPPDPYPSAGDHEKGGRSSARTIHRSRSRQRRNVRNGRTNNGSALSEFGPALFFLFIFAVFPVMDIIGLCFGYLSCVTMNDLQLREAAKVPKSQATCQSGAVQQAIPQKYMATVMGAFSGLTALPATQVDYKASTSAIYVTVSTTVTVRPFLTIPFFVKVPGLGEPATFTISNSRILENPRFAMQ